MERSSAIRYTYQDLLALPESATRHEILDGQLFVTAAPRVNHQRVVFALAERMRAFVREHDLGEVVGYVNVHVHDELVFEPDLVFIRSDRLGIVDPEGDVHGVPDLVVEVLSPSTRSYDEGLKRKRYLGAGVPEVWLVDVAERSMVVWRPGSEEPERAREVVAWRVGDFALEIALAEIFRGV